MMRLKIVNPATEETIRELESETSEGIRQKFLAARSAQIKWALRPLAERMQCIQRFRTLLVERQEHLAITLTSETGKPISQARNELKGVLSRIDFFLENVEPALGSQTVFQDAPQGLTERITYEPLGVVLNISAWNYPYFVGSNVFVPALLTGNSVLYKPSEFASLTGIAISECLHDAGVPRDVFTLVLGDGQVGAELLTHPVNGVFFTGSYSTGVKIAQSAARQMAKTQLELGGKDSVYVCDDVDVQAAADGTADGAFYNAGQSCCSVERIYVHEKIYDQFVESFVRFAQSVVVGDPRDDKTYLGPLARSAQLAHLEGQVQDAVEKGGVLLHGGKRCAGVGFYFEPTVVAHASHAMELMREESFGPVIGIQKVRSDEEALQLMNDTEYGLTAGVYSRDESRASRILAQVNAGSAYWNCCDRVSPRLPWSGRGHSGLGSTLGQAGILAFVQPKAWHLRG